MIRKKGFTLIELVIYLGIVIIIASLVLAFLPNIIKVNSFAQKKEMVVDSSLRALEIISQELKHASSIYTPTSVLDTNPGQISVQTSRLAPEGETSTYVDFYIDNEKLYIKREEYAAELLLPSKIAVTNLTFDRLSSTSSVAALRITLRTKYNSPSEEIQQRTLTNLTTTVSLRSY